MICLHCERQLKKKGSHRRHKHCQRQVVQGNVGGPCWCPACHPLTDRFIEYLRNLAPMSLDAMPAESYAGGEAD